MGESIGKMIAVAQTLVSKVAPAKIESAVDDWLEENITNPDSPPLDRSLSSNSSAAPADMVGELKSAVNDIENLEPKQETELLSPFVQGSVSQEDGTIDTSSATQCYIGKIPMKAGDSYTFSRSENKIMTTSNLAVYDTNGDFVSGRGVTTETTITFEADGMFAISAVLNSNVSATMEEAIEAANTSFNATLTTKSVLLQTIEEQDSRLDSLESTITSKQDTPEESGTAGQVLGLDSNLDPVWIDQQGGGGGSDIDDTAGAGDTDKAWSADKLTTKFGIIENLTSEQTTGYITSFKQGMASEINGTIDETDTTKCYSGLIDMHKGDSYSFSRSVNKIATTSYLAVYDTTGTFISGRSLITGNSVTFDNDGKFAITCPLNSGASATMQEAISAANSSFNASLDNTKKIVKVIGEHGDDISEINVEIGKIKGVHFTKEDLSTGAYYAISNGKATMATDSTAKYCDLIDVSAYKGARMAVHMNTRKAGSTRACGLCDADGNVGNYATETTFKQVGDGGYYKVLLIDEDYMFFSCSGDPTDIDIRIIDPGNMLTAGDYQKDKQTNKYYHMSFDDVLACLQDITTNASTYDSVFDNGLFGWCKSMHDLYGTTFSMYVFYENDAGTWNLENCTNAFASEFTANADWLKFGLHAYNSSTSYETSEARAASDYEDAIDELVRITGSVKCIDRVPRLHEYKGTLTALTAMRDCDLGCVGFIASADTDLTTPRDSYYFDSDENAYIYKHVYMHDSENHLHFVKTSYLWCSSNISITNIENTVTYFNRNKYVEIFFHENQLTSGMKEAFEEKFLMLSYSHLPYFMMDLVLTS